MSQSNGNLFYLTSEDGVNFCYGPPFQQSSTHAPAFAEFNGVLYIAWTGNGNDLLNLMPISATKPTTIQQTSETAPSLCVAGAQLYVGWTGQDSDHSLNIISTSDGVHFGTKTKIDESTNAGLSIVSFSGI